MENETIIYQTRPKINLIGLLISIAVSAILVYTSNSLTIKLLIGGFFIVSLIIITVRNQNSNGIIINENYIELTKNKSITEKIDFGNIKKIKWSDGRVKWDDRAIYLDTNKKNGIKVLINEDIFEFGHILKFLNDKGIEIELFHSDQELRMFLDGKITEFPMRNEKTA